MKLGVMWTIYKATDDLPVKEDGVRRVLFSARLDRITFPNGCRMGEENLKRRLSIVAQNSDGNTWRWASTGSDPILSNEHVRMLITEYITEQKRVGKGWWFYVIDQIGVIEREKPRAATKKAKGGANG